MSQTRELKTALAKALKQAVENIAEMQKKEAAGKAVLEAKELKKARETQDTDNVAVGNDGMSFVKAADGALPGGVGAHAGAADDSTGMKLAEKADDGVPCPKCGGKSQKVGKLGKADHYLCKKCGKDHSKEEIEKGETFIDKENSAVPGKRDKDVGTVGVVPGDKPIKEVSSSGAGGEIVAGKSMEKSEEDLEKGLRDALPGIALVGAMGGGVALGQHAMANEAGKVVDHHMETLKKLHAYYEQNPEEGVRRGHFTPEYGKMLRDGLDKQAKANDPYTKLQNAAAGASKIQPSGFESAPTAPAAGLGKASTKETSASGSGSVSNSEKPIAKKDGWRCKACDSPKAEEPGGLCFDCEGPARDEARDEAFAQMDARKKVGKPKMKKSIFDVLRAKKTPHPETVTSPAHVDKELGGFQSMVPSQARPVAHMVGQTLPSREGTHSDLPTNKAEKNPSAMPKAPKMGAEGAAATGAAAPSAGPPAAPAAPAPKVPSMPKAPKLPKAGK